MAATSVHLTDQQQRVLDLTRCGYSREEIAEEMDVNPWSVRKHQRRLCRKLGVQRPGALRAAAERMGIPGGDCADAEV